MPTVTIRDEVLGRRDAREFDLEVLTEHITVRELIRSRVYQEVQDHNRGSEPRSMLVRPEPTGTAWRGGERAGREVDWQAQCRLAIDAFERGQILVLVGDRQCVELDEAVRVATSTKVTFVRLVPLVGG
jgi:hypothetical protein